MDAPPPVEIQLILLARPNLLMAATESPPPMMDVQSESAIARATASVPFANWSISKTPHGAVPKNGLSALDGVAIQLDGLGADVHTHTVIRNIVGVHDLAGGILAKVIRDDVIYGQQDLAALCLGLLEHDGERRFNLSLALRIHRVLSRNRTT